MKGSKISWGITSHWGDFQSVNGRLTSDQHHRALDGNARPDRSALIRKEYANDLGFLHAEQAVNLVAIYQVMETRYKLVKKKKWYGYSKYKQVEYEEEVDRETDLRFNLSSKYLPVVYGVQKIDSIPFFVDTDKNDSKQVFVAYALCEGEIGGIYDMYIDDTSSICIDKNDFDTRSAQTEENTIEVLCKGRMDRGDVMGSIATTSTSNQTLTDFVPRSWMPGVGSVELSRFEDRIKALSAQYQSAGETGVATASGIGHERTHVITDPIDAKFTMHLGKRGQSANPLLVDKAQSNSFKIQNDYFDKKQEYWGTNHRVLDTAYMVAHYTIGEGETTIPEIDFVVRGKLVKCYNYDWAYGRDVSGTSSALSNFEIGDEVTIKKTSDNSTLASNVVINDIFSFLGQDGESFERIQFQNNPGLGTTTAFYMQKGSDKYYLETWDNETHSGTVPAKLEETITSNQSGTSSGVQISVNQNGLSAKAWQHFPDLHVNPYNSTGYSPEFDWQTYYEFMYDYNNTVGTIDNVGDDTNANFNSANIDTIVTKDAIALDSGASGTDDSYNGKTIIVTKLESDGSEYVLSRERLDYDGVDKIA